MNNSPSYIISRGNLTVKTFLYFEETIEQFKDLSLHPAANMEGPQKKLAPRAGEARGKSDDL